MASGLSESGMVGDCDCSPSQFADWETPNFLEPALRVQFAEAREEQQCKSSRRKLTEVVLQNDLASFPVWI